VCLVAAVVSVALIGAPVSSARPSHDDLEAARSRLTAATERLDALVEQYDHTSVTVDALTTRLAELRRTRNHAEARAEEARSRLDAAAAEAYKGTFSPLDVVLSARSIADLTSRLEFLDTVAQFHRDIATTAQVQGEQAREARERLVAGLVEQRGLLDSLGQQKARIEHDVSDLEGEIDRLQEALRKPVVIDLAASTSTSHPPAASPPPAPATAPPPVASGAAAAIAAAESVIGTPYQYGGASPQEGFDCSGLTMWAWAHAGVSLPHSSVAQYEALPHVDQSQLQPGDLVFFYSPIHHVGLYVGGGMMIDAPHTGTVVQRRAVEWSVYTGAARPG
jgi:cell wall-associated NlpC family hydrolase